MIDRYVLPYLARSLQRPAAWLAPRYSADQITLLGFALGLLALPALAFGWFALALALIVLNRLLDGLDGAIARINGPTDRGAFLDISLDFLFYASVPLGFAFFDPAANALPAAVLLVAFIGTGSSFLAFSAIAAQRGLKSEQYPSKGIYYLGGLTEGAETIAVFVLMCLFPAFFALLAWIFAAACFVTTLVRWYLGWTLLGKESPPA